MASIRNIATLKLDIASIEKTNADKLDIIFDVKGTVLNRFEEVLLPSQKISESRIKIAKKLSELLDAVTSVEADSVGALKHSFNLAQIFPEKNVNYSNLYLIKQELESLGACLFRLKKMRDNQKEQFTPICTAIETLNKDLKSLTTKFDAISRTPSLNSYDDSPRINMCKSAMIVLAKNKELLNLYNEYYDSIATIYEQIRQVINKSEKEIYLPDKQRFDELEKILKGLDVKLQDSFHDLRIVFKTKRDQYLSQLESRKRNIGQTLKNFDDVKLLEDKVVTGNVSMSDAIHQLDIALASVTKDADDLLNHSRILSSIILDNKDTINQMPAIKSELETLNLCITHLKSMRTNQHNNVDLLYKDMEKAKGNLKSISSKLEGLKKAKPPKDSAELYKSLCESYARDLEVHRDLFKSNGELFDSLAALYVKHSKLIDKTEKEIYLPYKQRFDKMQITFKTTNSSTSAKLHAAFQQTKLQASAVNDNNSMHQKSPVPHELTQSQTPPPTASLSDKGSITSFQLKHSAGHEDTYIFGLQYPTLS